MAFPTVARALSRMEHFGDGEMDVDYFCGSERPADRINETGYWFGTDSDGISTELVGTG